MRRTKAQGHIEQEIAEGGIAPSDIDQEILTAMYIRDCSRVNIDWKGELFHNLLFRSFITRQPDLSDLIFRGDRILNEKTGSWPGLLHASGNTYMSSLVKALGYEACLSMKDFTTTRAY